MTNPLLQKYEELYGKKEEPKKVEYEFPKDYNGQFITHDTHSGNDSFLQIAEKVKNKEAQVTSVSYIQDRVGVFSTGLTTITFEVQVWDTP